MLIAYLDESGAVGTPILTIAGYPSDESKWKRFECEWRKCLKEHGARYLHMRELSQSRGEFKGWPEEKRRAFLGQLISIIKSCVVFRVGAVVPYKDYQQTVGAIEPQPNRLTPFWCCFLSSISAILAYCEQRGITDGVALVFDENTQPKRHADGYFASLQELPEIKNRHQLVSLSFADDKEATPLQAADLLAYELNKYHRGYVRWPLQLLNDIEGTFVVCDRQMLEKYTYVRREVEK